MIYEAFRFVLENIRKYFRIELHGVENIPRRGKAIIAPNHSGCSGLDAVMLGYTLYLKTPRIPRILTLWDFFRLFPVFEPAAHRLGLKPASTDNGIGLLKKNNLVVCFPEGEAGPFKPSSKRYQLQEFHTGFIRMALLTGAPIIPCVIIGAEESNINLGSFKVKKKKKIGFIPVPFNMLPLPAKWDIRFFAPVDLSAHREFADDKVKLQQLADELKMQMQTAINAELADRKYVYLKLA
jgi:1-acyl-sn-glycerol-3-phosphate acyltransferase